MLAFSRANIRLCYLNTFRGSDFQKIKILACFQQTMGMLEFAYFFFALAVIAALLGFIGLVGLAALTAKLLCLAFLGLFLVATFRGHPRV